MSHTSTCAAWRAHLISGVAIAGVAILAAGMVKAPPDFSSARTEVHAVKVAALTFPSTAPSAATLKKFVGNQAETTAFVRSVLRGREPADVGTDAATAPFTPTTTSTTDPVLESQLVGILPSPFSPDLLVGNIMAIIANPVLLVIAPLVYGFFALIVVVALLQSVTANSAGFAAAAPLASEPMLSGVGETTMAVDTPEVSPRVKSRKPPTKTEHMSTDATASTGEPPASSVPERPDGEDASGPGNATGQAHTPRPVKRESFDASDQRPGPSEHRKGGRSATVDEGTKAEPSPVATSSADSSSKHRGSSHDDSASGKTDGSE